MGEGQPIAEPGRAFPLAPGAAATTTDAAQPAAAYPRAALERLRAALRAGLLPAPPDKAGRDPDPPEPAAALAAPAGASDPLPEQTVYRDEGCHIAPACLRCPLERCIFDRPVHADAAVRRGRNRRMRTLARRGWAVERLARDFQLSTVHVRRILRGEPGRRKGQ